MNNDYYFNVLKVRYSGRQLAIGEDTSCLLAAKEVLANVLNAGLRKEIDFFLIDPKTNTPYYYEFDKGTTDRIFIMRVANRRERVTPSPHCGMTKETDHPFLYVIINTMDDNDHIVMIERYPKVYQAIDEVTRVLNYSLNLMTKPKGWDLKLVPHEMSRVQELGMMAVCSALEHRLGSERTIEGLYGNDEAQRRIYCREAEKKNTKKKYFISALYDKSKLNKVTCLINQLLEGTTETRDMIMPFRAAIEAGVSRHASWAEVKETFNLDEKLRSSYYRLISDPNTYNHPAFREIVSRFKAL